jgi:hypothetical protein
MKETQRIGGQEVPITIGLEPKRSTLSKTSISDNNVRRFQSVKKPTSHHASSKVGFVEPSQRVHRIAGLEISMLQHTIPVETEKTKN